MNILAIKNFLKLEKEPMFRLGQIERAYFVELKNDWQDISGLSLGLREKLAANFPFSPFTDSLVLGLDRDGAQKARLTLHDGAMIETVLIRHGDGRRTVCVSSQVGCPLACAFCATGKMGFKRNLSTEEIVGQVIFWARELKKKDEKITNVVFMGMGEPFLNFEKVSEAIHEMNDPEKLGLASRRISISTAGIIDGLNRFGSLPGEINLAISLHSANEGVRSKLMPINRTVSIKTLMKSVDDYISKTKRRVMIEYLMIDEINDSEKDAELLAKLLSGRRLCYVNLIPYNETKKFKPSKPEAIKKFSEVLKRYSIAHTLRKGFGAGIDAACGQLAGRNNQEEKN